MPTIHEIRETRAAKVAEARALLAGDMTAEKQTAFDKLKAEITDLEAAEQRQQFIDDMERRAAGEPVNGGDGLADLEKRVSLLDVLRSQMEGRSLSGAAAEYSQEAERRTGRKAPSSPCPCWSSAPTPRPAHRRSCRPSTALTCTSARCVRP